jgi:hypothetical protein
LLITTQTMQNSNHPVLTNIVFIKENYVRPEFTDFKPEYVCPHCQFHNENTPLQVVELGPTLRIYRICCSCGKTTDFHISPTLSKRTEAVSSCASCICKKYEVPPENKNSDSIKSIICRCGHMGSYHCASHRVVEQSWLRAKTMKSAICSSFDHSEHEDIIY